jgi:L-2-hydroxyglutarate oxidase
VARIADAGRAARIDTSRGRLEARYVVACAGVQADRLAGESAGGTAIVPFRGDYFALRRPARRLCRNLIYPVPDPRLPFLGVHLTRRIDGEVLVGPTALLVGGLRWPGTWRMARRFWRTGVSELRHAASRRALAAAAARYVPDLGAGDVVPGPSGVRAQALGRDGSLVDDFVVSETERALHVRNAPSPAATSSLALARLVADRVEAGLS